MPLHKLQYSSTNKFFKPALTLIHTHTRWILTNGHMISIIWLGKQWSNLNEEKDSNVVILRWQSLKNQGAWSLCKIYLRLWAIHAYMDPSSSFYPIPKLLQILHPFHSSHNPKWKTLTSLTQWTTSILLKQDPIVIITLGACFLH